MTEAEATKPSDLEVRPVPRWFRFLALALGVFLLAVAYAMYRGYTEVVIGEHQNRVQWLPAGAEDASFYRSRIFIGFEFNLPEDKFLAWAKSSTWEMKPIDQPITVLRYTSGPEFKRVGGEPLTHTVTRGHFWLSPGKDGSGIAIVYDSDQKRAYYEYKTNEYVKKYGKGGATGATGMSGATGRTGATGATP